MRVDILTRLVERFEHHFYIEGIGEGQGEILLLYIIYVYRLAMVGVCVPYGNPLPALLHRDDPRCIGFPFLACEQSIGRPVDDSLRDERWSTCKIRAWHQGG